MSPIKLVILAILFYVLYRLLAGMGKKKFESKPLDEKYSSPVADALVEDPICHTLVPKGQALRLQHENKIYYFCSEACCSRFISEKGEQK
ncbi:MAG: TRASH domain protein [Desulfocapsaceae bacterium]|nr:TRASH domain protein [Desulfocapsaceae bacterium]